MKKRALSILLYKLLPLFCFSQVSTAEITLLQKLDSLNNKPSIAAHFSELYFNTTIRAMDFFLHDEAPAKRFIERLEISFADFFFRSADAFARGADIPAEWKAYFSDTSLSSLQYELLGINAHINGDIWQALTKEFSLKEIQENRKTYFNFQKALSLQYRDFYQASLASSSLIRTLHATTLGLDKLYGKIMLVKWRKRQMRMAILYFTDPPKFNKKLGRLHAKMERINTLILRHL